MQGIVTSLVHTLCKLRSHPTAFTQVASNNLARNRPGSWNSSQLGLHVRCPDRRLKCIGVSGSKDSSEGSQHGASLQLSKIQPVADEPQLRQQLISQILDDVAVKGWAICPGFISPQLVGQLRSEVDDLYASGSFAPAQVCHLLSKMCMCQGAVHWNSYTK